MQTMNKIYCIKNKFLIFKKTLEIAGEKGQVTYKASLSGRGSLTFLFFTEMFKARKA